MGVVPIAWGCAAIVVPPVEGNRICILTPLSNGGLVGVT